MADQLIRKFHTSSPDRSSGSQAVERPKKRLRKGTNIMFNQRYDPIPMVLKWQNEGESTELLHEALMFSKDGTLWSPGENEEPNSDEHYMAVQFVSREQLAYTAMVASGPEPNMVIGLDISYTNQLPPKNYHLLAEFEGLQVFSNLEPEPAADLPEEDLPKRGSKIFRGTLVSTVNARKRPPD
ncbi:hypothetical protein TWF788_004571 [Orbilia oligospora]|uniref:Uncharacterized protein n=1 Tax=Orbilia oligospora TaxID=2813651 RepID=A0A7C8P2F3_ORBOL|nr:hypothetical protein TWF788_004571 [Orbilia oligospora]